MSARLGEAGVSRLEFEPVLGWSDAEPLLGPWGHLAREACTPWLPFQEPVWASTWWEHWARRDRLRGDRFVLWTGRDDEGVLRAVLPTVLSELPAGGPLRLRLFRAVGPDPNITELQPMVCCPEDAAAAHEGLLRALLRHLPHWDGFRWASVPSTVSPALRARPDFSHVRTVPDYLLDLGAGFESFQRALPRNAKEAMRRARNAPRRAGIEFSFSVARTPDEMRRHLPEFLRLHGARAHARLAPAHPDVFVDESARCFLLALVERWCRTGIALALVLRHGERVVASRLGFLLDETLYLYYSGFDPEYAPFSVMTRTLVDGLEWAVESGVRLVNLSTGTDHSKTRWRPRCASYDTLWQWAPSHRGRWSRLLHRLFGRDRRRGDSE